MMSPIGIYIIGWLLGGFTCVSIFVAIQENNAHKFWKEALEKDRQRRIKELGYKYSDME